MVCKYCNDTGFVSIPRKDVEGSYIWKKCMKCGANFTDKFSRAGIDRNSFGLKISDFENNNFKKRFIKMMKKIKADKSKNNYLILNDNESELLRYCDYLSLNLIKQNHSNKIYFSDDIFDIHFKNIQKYKKILKLDTLCMLLGTEYLKSENSMIITFLYKFLLMRHRNNKKTFLFYFKNNNSCDSKFEINKRYGQKITKLIFDSNIFDIISGEM